jgi:hypothetical protein
VDTKIESKQVRKKELRQMANAIRALSMDAIHDEVRRLLHI